MGRPARSTLVQHGFGKLPVVAGHPMTKPRHFLTSSRPCNCTDKNWYRQQCVGIFHRGPICINWYEWTRKKKEIVQTHLRKIDRNKKNLSSKNTWSTSTRKLYGVQRYPAWVWVGPALGLRAKSFKIWSHGTKKICSKISLHKVSKVPCGYFVGFLSQNSFSGLIG